MNFTLIKGIQKIICWVLDLLNDMGFGLTVFFLAAGNWDREVWWWYIWLRLPWKFINRIRCSDTPPFAGCPADRYHYYTLSVLCKESLQTWCCSHICYSRVHNLMVLKLSISLCVIYMQLETLQCDQAEVFKSRLLFSMNSGRLLLEHFQRCSVCDLAKIFFTSKFSRVLFSNRTHTIKIATANTWETTNQK